MSDALDMKVLDTTIEDNYKDGVYQVQVVKAEVKIAGTGRPYISLQTKIEDSTVMTEGRIPLGEMLFPRFMTPLTTDAEGTQKFFSIAIQKFLKSVGALDHPDYASLDGTMANPALWDLAIGGSLKMTVKYKEQSKKEFNPETGKTEKVMTGDFDYEYSNFKAVE